MPVVLSQGSPIHRLRMIADDFHAEECQSHSYPFFLLSPLLYSLSTFTKMITKASISALLVGLLGWLAGMAGLAGWLVWLGWLAGWPVGWVAGWLAGWYGIVAGLAGWLAGWLAGCLAGLGGWVAWAAWLVGLAGLAGRLAAWLVGRLAKFGILLASTFRISHEKQDSRIPTKPSRSERAMLRTVQGGRTTRTVATGALNNQNTYIQKTKRHLAFGVVKQRPSKQNMNGHMIPQRRHKMVVTRRHD